MRLLRVALFAVTILSVMGCALPASKTRYRRPQMTAGEIGTYYEYPRKPIEARVREKERNSRYVHQIVEFDLQFPADIDPASIVEARRLAASAPNEIRQKNLSLDYSVRFDYYRPTTPGRHPLVLVSPILGGNTIFAADFCRYFASHGFCAALVHRRRLSLRAEDGLDKVEADLRKSVLRIRQALDWASEQPEVDPSNAASFGISYGAIINTIAAGAEPRIKYHIFALGGGDLPNIIISTTEPQIRRQVAKIGGHRKWNREQLREALEQTIRSDPLNSAPLLDPENVLMVVAQFDVVVGTQYENLLWRRIGKPRRIVVPLGHATSALALPFIKGETLRFLQDRFGIAPAEDGKPALQFYRSKPY